MDKQAKRERTEVYSHEETARERTAHAAEKVRLFHKEEIFKIFTSSTFTTLMPDVHSKNGFSPMYCT